MDRVSEPCPPPRSPAVFWADRLLPVLPRSPFGSLRKKHSPRRGGKWGCPHTTQGQAVLRSCLQSWEAARWSPAPGLPWAPLQGAPRLAVSHCSFGQGWAPRSWLSDTLRFLLPASRCVPVSCLFCTVISVTRGGHLRPHLLQPLTPALSTGSAQGAWGRFPCRGPDRPSLAGSGGPTAPLGGCGWWAASPRWGRVRQALGGLCHHLCK